MPEFAQRERRTQSRQIVSPSRLERRNPLPARAGNPILAGQQVLGNQAMLRLAQTCPVFPGRCPTGGVCHTCPTRAQAKLTVGQPGDKYEQEADRVAEQVMRMPDPGNAERAAINEQAQGARLQRECSECDEELQRQPIEEEEEETLQTKEESGRTPEVSPALQGQIQAMRSGGQPLPASVRGFFEPRFGRDFSQVRVHNDAMAAESARAVNAKAFTIGRDIVFREGQYSPDAPTGKRLLAHELTHVIQQCTRRVGKNINRISSDFIMKQEATAPTCSLTKCERSVRRRNVIIEGRTSARSGEAHLYLHGRGTTCMTALAVSIPHDTSIRAGKFRFVIPGSISTAPGFGGRVLVKVQSGRSSGICCCNVRAVR